MFYEVVAEIVLLSTQDGGRSGATPADKFGCIAVLNGNNFDVRFDLSTIGSLRPGTTASVPMRFLDPECASRVFPPGTQFDLRELRTIGHGTVRQTLPSDARRGQREGVFAG